MTALALTYRPQRFDQIVGQKAARAVLRQMALKRDLPPALLIYGPRGTGKTTSGRILAAALNAPDGQGDVDLSSPHARAILSGSSPDVLEIDAASNGNVDDVRALKDVLNYSTNGEYRVVLLDEAHSMSREAFNALLKTLEEPPPNTLFVLLTTEPHRIIGTVQSRCMSIEMKKVSSLDVMGRLRHICEQESIPHDDSLLRAISRRSDGGVRDAVMLLDQAARVGIRTDVQLMRMLDEVDFAPALMTALLDQDLGQALMLAETQVDRSGDPTTVVDGLVVLIRHIITLQVSKELDMDEDMLHGRRVLAERLDSAGMTATLRRLWDYRTKVRGGDPSAAMFLCLAMVAEVLASKVSTAAVAAPMSLDQLRSV